MCPRALQGKYPTSQTAFIFSVPSFPEIHLPETGAGAIWWLKKDIDADI